MADVMQSSAAAVRAADALLRAGGGRQVLLRTPLPATPGDASEQLGLAMPTFQEVVLAPAVLRQVGKTGQRELLVSAGAVESVAGSLTYASSSVLFAQADGVVVDETLYTIEAVTTSEIFGMPYLYRLILRPPISLLL